MLYCCFVLELLNDLVGLINLQVPHLGLLHGLQPYSLHFVCTLSLTGNLGLTRMFFRFCGFLKITLGALKKYP